MNQDKYFDFIINGIQLGKFQQQFSVNDMTDFHRFKLGTACSIQNFNMSIIRNCEHEQLFDNEIENIDVYLIRALKAESMNEVKKIIDVYEERIVNKYYK